MFLFCLAALVAGAPQIHEGKQRPIAILQENHEDAGDGNFEYGFQSENGIAVEVSGVPGDKGQNRVKGVYR